MCDVCVLIGRNRTFSICGRLAIFCPQTNTNTHTHIMSQHACASCSIIYNLSHTFVRVCPSLPFRSSLILMATHTYTNRRCVCLCGYALTDMFLCDLVVIICPSGRWSICHTAKRYTRCCGWVISGHSCGRAQKCMTNRHVTCREEKQLRNGRMSHPTIWRRRPQSAFKLLLGEMVNTSHHDSAHESSRRQWQQ